MEKRVVLAMVLSVAMIFAWTALMPSPPRQPGVGGTPIAGQGTIGVATGTPAGGTDAPGQPRAPVVAPLLPAPPADDVPETTVEADVGALALQMTSRGGALRRADVWACEYHDRNEGVVGDPGVATDYFEGHPGLGSIDLIGLGTSLSRRSWRVERTTAGLRAIADLADEGVRVISEFRPSVVPGAPYHVDLVVTLEGLAGGRTGALATMEVMGPWLAKSPHPVPEDGVLIARTDDDVEEFTPEEIVEHLVETPGYEQQAPAGLRWIGARSDFHLGALEPIGNLPQGTTIGFHAAVRDEGTPDEWRSAAASVRFPVIIPGERASESFAFRIYAGPNSRPVLTDESRPYASLEEALPERGLWILSFGPISKMLRWLLQLLASTGMGYGLAVASLTVLVRGALFPLSRKSQVSMRVHGKKMAALKPKMDALKAKIKDPQKQQQAIMKLMREEKVSPVPGGCLLAFVQMPIWIALYGVLQTTYEMRHAKFLWAADLTAPDHFMRLDFAADWPILNGWLNLFPILMMITWGISSHMQPLPEDPQQRQTAKMMRWMPMAFGFFLYGYPCGLTIYMTCSALWSICEVQVIRRVWLSKLDV